MVLNGTCQWHLFEYIEKILLLKLKKIQFNFYTNHNFCFQKPQLVMVSHQNVETGSNQSCSGLNQYRTSLNGYRTSLNQYRTSLNRYRTSLHRYHTSLNRYRTSLNRCGLLSFAVRWNNTESLVVHTKLI